MFERFTDRARRVVVLAQEEARMLNHNYIGTEHILLGLIHEGEGVAAKALESLGISLEAVRQQVEEIIGQGQQAPSGHIPFTPRAKKVLELSLREALQLGHNYIGTEHILLGLIREGEGVAAQVLVKLGADLNRVRQQVIQLLHGYQGKEPASSGAPQLQKRWFRKARPTLPVLGPFCRNLTEAVRLRELDPIAGRGQEIERIMQVLSRRTRSKPLLVGVPGVGKTATVVGLAQQIVNRRVPDSFAGREIYVFDFGAAADAPPGQDTVIAMLEKIADEVAKNSKIILFLDDLRVQLRAVNPNDAVDVAPALRSVLSRSDLQVIAATTSDEYRAHLENDITFERAFQPIQLAELSVTETIEALKVLRDGYEAHHRVSITDGAIVAAAQLASSSLPGKLMPGKAVDLLDDAASMVSVRTAIRPPDVRKYDETIRAVRQEKDSAIDSMDFEKAAALRDKEGQLMREREVEERRWGDGYAVAEVGEEIIMETLAIMSGVSFDSLADVQDPRKEKLVSPIVTTGDDREIWGMA